MSNKCKICAGIVNRKKPGLQCSSFCAEYYRRQCLGLTINQLYALRFGGASWNFSDCRGDRVLPSRRSLQTMTPNPSQQMPQSPFKSRSSQADSNEVFDALQQIREEMRLLRDSVSSCSNKITDFQSDLTTLRERDRSETGFLKSDGGGVLKVLKQGFYAAPQVNLQSEAEDLWISLNAKKLQKTLYLLYIPTSRRHYSLLLFSIKITRKSTYL
ncbi:hypothetical protein JTB14_014085 [Gonioctena quinquepunctata]|nr:hypothetical protein JTB14_014085 [Gonioctena quinquepunctata]